MANRKLKLYLVAFLSNPGLQDKAKNHLSHSLYLEKFVCKITHMSRYIECAEIKKVCRD